MTADLDGLITYVNRLRHSFAEVAAAMARAAQKFSAAFAALYPVPERPVDRARRLYIERWMRARDRRALRHRRRPA
jgi:hypothetical protein